MRQREQKAEQKGRCRVRGNKGKTNMQEFVWWKCLSGPMVFRGRKYTVHSCVFRDLEEGEEGCFFALKLDTEVGILKSIDGVLELM